MPRGQPDYGMYSVKEVGGSLADMADLAVRLGSIVEYDRRGDIIFLDDFEELILKWNTPVTGVGYVRLDSTIAKSGSQSVKLYTDAGGADTAALAKYFVVLGVLRVGIEISLSDLTDDADFIFHMTYWDGTTSWRARLWFDHSATTFYVFDEIRDDWVEVVNYGSLRRGAKLFFPIKLVMDFVNHTYLRVMIGGSEYDLSAYTFQPIGGAGGIYLLTQFTLLNTAAVNNQCWVDDFILTMNEP